MTLTTATKLGPYEILGPIGAGGMGEVYRAKDTRLDRVVAIKVLPAHLSSNPDLRQRFEREARAVSSLNHPHICTLHDIGHQNGIDYIVMEYIEGETLGSRLQKGPLSQQELLRYSIQIADALDKAHKQGIIHRDLKPANIILTKAGAKLLDFGLARLGDPQKANSEVSSLPTEFRELTQEGMVLGTFQYMAPEQLEGRLADARTDIFSFGAVLYEMATGKKAFEGKSQASLIAAILKEEPKAISDIQPLTPPILERLIKTCLAKDPDDRWQNAHDIGNQLRWIVESSGSQVTTITPAAIAKSIVPPNRLGWIVAGLILLTSLIGAFFLVSRMQKQPREPIQTQFSISPPFSGTSLFALNQADPNFAISPDGTKFVFIVAESNEKDQLWLRPFASVEARPISGTEGARLPFWSPDGQYIAFASRSRIVKVPLSGTTPQFICDLSSEFRGGEWLKDGTIIFATANSGLSRVSADGGQPKLITQLNTSDSRGHAWPSMLPDQKHFLFLNDSSNLEKRALFMGTLDSNEVSMILKTPFMGRYLDPGYLMYVQGSSLVAQRFKVKPPHLSGNPVRIADAQLPMNLLRSAVPYTSSANGVITYSVAGVFQKTQLAWFDRSGKPLGTVGPVGSDVSVTLSPNDSKAVITSPSEIGRSMGRAEIPVNIWVVDLARGLRTRVTFDQSISDENPIWSPDGRFLIFAVHRHGAQAKIYRKVSSGEGEAEPVLEGDSNEHPIDWSADGKYLLVHRANDTSGLDLMYLPLSENPKPQLFLATQFQEAQGQFSPNGRWVAYTSGESGREEVYVKPFPSGEGKWQISSGGSEPRWRADGKELFYLSTDGSLMVVEVNAENTFETSPPVTLFKSNLSYQDLDFYGGAHRYDVTRDGQRFLVNTIVVPATPTSLNVIVNWNPPR